MKCLYCGKQIGDNASSHEKEHHWHSRCIRSFFGTSKMPTLDISESALEVLANDTVNKGFTVPGVQKKLSLHLSVDTEFRLTLVDYPTGYILKPQSAEYKFLPEFEHIAMSMAQTVGIKTVPNALIINNGQFAYITKRIDRNASPGKEPKMFAMEDFCQLAERVTLDKYKGSYEKCGRIIKDYSSVPGLDQSELFTRVVFSFVIGNSDMHLKNFSLIESAPGNRSFSLSPAYDMLPVNTIIPEDNDEMALTLNGKRKRIRRQDFLSFAQSCNINSTAAEKMITSICKMEEELLHLCDESYLPEYASSQLKSLISHRITILKG